PVGVAEEADDGGLLRCRSNRHGDHSQFGPCDMDQTNNAMRLLLDVLSDRSKKTGKVPAIQCIAIQLEDGLVQVAGKRAAPDERAKGCSPIPRPREQEIAWTNKEKLWQVGARGIVKRI